MGLECRLGGGVQLLYGPGAFVNSEKPRYTTVLLPLSVALSYTHTHPYRTRSYLHLVRYYSGVLTPDQCLEAIGKDAVFVPSI